MTFWLGLSVIIFFILFFSFVIFAEIWIIFKFQKQHYTFYEDILEKYSEYKFTDIFEKSPLKIYVICMSQRKYNMKKVLASYHIENYTLINPIMHRDLNLTELMKNNIVAKQNNFKNLAEVACCLSHLKTLRTFYETSQQEDEKSLIFEDDIKALEEDGKSKKDIKKKKDYENEYKIKLFHLQNDLKDLEKICEKNEDAHWDILYLGHCWSDCTKAKNITRNMTIDNEALCTHSYVITKKGAGIVLDFSRLAPMNKPFDEMILDLVKMKKLKAISFFSPIFFQNRDNIGSTLGNLDKLPVCR